MTLMFKPGKIYRSSGTWKDDDYDVFAGGKLVGRIYEHPSDSTLPQLRWFWSIIAIEPPIPNVTNGHAPTLNEAKSKFRAAWEKAEQAAKHARRRAKSAA